jgi:hypothetical protein
MRTHLFHYFHGENELHPIMLFGVPFFFPIMKDIRFHVSHGQTHVILMLSFQSFIDELTSCYQLMTFITWLMLSLLIPFEQI